jgi:CRISPR-associated protein Csx10
VSNNQQNFILETPFTVRVEMLSDWHVGTGTGIPGSIDALLAKDSEGFPQVPAKTIVGIWRDAMETLTISLDGGTEGDWSKWVEAIFGSQPSQLKQDEVQTLAARNELKPRPAIVTSQPARINENLRRKINSFINLDQTKYKQALTFIKPEIKIDEASGTSATEMLRFAEMGRVGTVLEAVCEVHWEQLDNVSPEQKQTISALLIASAKLAERIGGKRRRGSGKCRLEIVGREIAKKEIADGIIKHLSEQESALNVPPVKETDKDHGFAAPDSDTKWQKLEYTLKLKTPVSIVTATLGNVSETLDFLPGTYLLPHLTKGKNLFQYIANGDIQVSPATIEVNGKRGLPVPKVLSAYKVGGDFDKERTVFNKFEDPIDEHTRQLKPFREGYVSELGEDGKLPVREKTPQTLMMHNTVEDDVQRPTSEVGGVYSRQAIAVTRVVDGETRPTVLRGEIRFKKSVESELKSIENKSHHIRLGTSKKDDYGLAELMIGNVQAANSAATANTELIVYLESDVLLRNENLRQTNLVCDLKKELEKAFGSNSLECTEDSLIQTRRIESWNVGWGFPRPTLIAMAAGSCVKFTIKDFDSFDPPKIAEISDKLSELQNSGIGERRGEGYGRIRFNPRILMEPVNSWGQVEKVRAADPSPESVSDEIAPQEKLLTRFAMQLELTAWREELHRAVLLIADDADNRREIFGLERKGSDSVPPLNQVGGLRSAIIRLRDQKNDSKEVRKLVEESKRIVIEWLEHLEETSNRIKKWDKNDNPERAKDKTKQIKKLINQDSKIWLILCEGEVDGKRVWQSPPMLVRTKEEMQKLLWAEAVRALFDACVRAHKRDLG